jgi:hypothetical protein
MKMTVKERFLALTSRTYPHGTERELFHLLPKDLNEDEFGNLFIKIGVSDVMFTSHLDTATKANTIVKHVFDGNIIKTDGKSILGADDKAGVTIMLSMIENKIPGLYYFFLGEEVGCVGSRKVAGVQKVEKLKDINKVISFDRRGTDSVITFQSSQRCCSDKFGDALAKEFNDIDKSFSYKKDKNGILTDSIQFVSIYPECTNISVGYQNEHSFTETQNIEHLEKLVNACMKVNWNELPVDRDPATVEYDDWHGANSGIKGNWGSGAWGSEYYDFDEVCKQDARTSRYTSAEDYLLSREKSSPKVIKNFFHDRLFNYVSNINCDLNNKVVSVDLCPARVRYEKKLISELFTSIDLDFVHIDWDGFTLDLYYKGGHRTSCDRNDLIELLPDLDYTTLNILDEYDDYPHESCDFYV